MRRTFPLMIAAGGLLLAGCGGGSAASAAAPATPTGHTIALHFHVTGDPNNYAACEQTGRGGYSDIGPATAVTIYDGSQHIIATAPLGTCTRGPGGAGATPQWVSNWSATVPDVPDVPIYQVEVGHRGKLTFNRADLASKGWTVSASLGS